jgi:ABC-2 type transport system permease protein
MMFRFDFILWVVVDITWMSVNILVIEVVFNHVDSMAGWSKPEMLLLVGISVLIMRLFMTFFMTNLFQVDRNVRMGTFDFYLAQPGNPLFMISTRKIELDGALNSIFAIGIILYALNQMDVSPGFLDVLAFCFMILCGLVIHYSTVVMIVSLAFWIVRVEGIEMGYFTLFDFSRLPRAAITGVMTVIFVYFFPAVIVSNFPAEALLAGTNMTHLAWLTAMALAWFAAAVSFFNFGLSRYTSASS